jgi:hypothetical protein
LLSASFFSLRLRVGFFPGGCGAPGTIAPEHARKNQRRGAETKKEALRKEKN